MLRKFRFLGFVLAFSLLAGNLCIANVNAATGVGQPAVGIELSGLRITEVDRPVAGKPLDLKARVRTSENVTWEIPIIWTDENGNVATVAESGKTYYPNFAFYVPEGYWISERAYVSGKLNIKIPEFLSQQFGQDSILYAVDADKAITYITFLPALSGIAKKASNEQAAQIAPAPQSTDTSGSSYDDEPESPNDEGDDPSEGGGGDVDPVDQVALHCSQKAIDEIGRDLLETFVGLIKDKLEPQAVHLLRTSFDAYNDAYANNDEERALGQNIGLLIYYGQETLYDMTFPAGVLAFVSGRYTDDVFNYLLALDADSFMTKDTSGNWHFNEDEETDLENTVIHEMMHGFMYDYTRQGIVSSDNAFPLWFTEGSASAVENVYQYRARLFQTLGEGDGDEYDDSQGRYTQKIEYTPAEILLKYIDSSLVGSNRYDLCYASDYGHNTGSAYVSGYLAFVYLSYLAAIHMEETNIIYYDEGEEVCVDISKIRAGANSILQTLHNGTSLDGIIRDISPVNGDEDPIYASTDDFQDKFIKGTDEDDEIINGDTIYQRTLLFTTNFLNFLENKSDYSEGTNNDDLANGSILLDEQSDVISPLDPDVQIEPDNIYQIPDESGYAVSTADNDRAYDQTGGKSDLPDSDSSDDGIINFPGQPVDDEDEAIAARTADEAAGEADPVITAGDAAPSDEGAPTGDNTTDGAQSVQEAPSVDAISQVEEIPAAVQEAPVIPETPATDVMQGVSATDGIVPDVTAFETQMSPEADSYEILPHEEDALPPNEMQLAEEPHEEPAGDPSGGDSSGTDSSDTDSSGGDSSEDAPSDGGEAPVAEEAE
ncbi:MAG: hypothetical protein K6F87_06965 [Lachnospiraceae bacterium]|nr:hypothetical protein [Lachnospiraceae bacterium]